MFLITLVTDKHINAHKLPPHPPTPRHHFWKAGINTVTKVDSLIMDFEQTGFEDGFERGIRIKVAEFLRQTLPDRWASLRK